MVKTASEMAAGNVVAAARMLGTTRATVDYRLARKGRGKDVS